MSTRYVSRASQMAVVFVGLVLVPGLGRAQESACPQVEPKRSAHSRQAEDYTKQGERQSDAQTKRGFQTAALNALREGMAAEPQNPLHFFMAGQLLLELEDYAGADSAWDRAACLWEPYAERIGVQRVIAWRALYTRAQELLASGDEPAAMQAYRNAYAIYDQEPYPVFQLAVHCVGQADVATSDSARQAHLDQAVWAFREAMLSSRRSGTLSDEDRTEFVRTAAANAAQILAVQQRYEEAADVYADLLAADPGDLQARSKYALFLTMQVHGLRESARLAEDSVQKAILAARGDSLAEVVRGHYRELVALEGTGLDAGSYHDIGLGLYELDSYPEAAAAFGRALALEPYRPQSLVFLAHSLYQGERYDTLSVVAQRLIEFYPCNGDNFALLAQSYRELEKPQQALEVLQRREALPIEFVDISLENGVAFGQLKSRKLEAGAPIEVEFTFYDAAGNAMGTGYLSIVAPAQGEQVPFRVAPEAQGAEASAVRPSGVTYRLVRPS